MTPCARCGETAQVVLGFDYPGRLMWLEDLGPGFNRFSEIPLCELHSDRLTSPRGWELIDSRTVAPPLFLAADVA